MGELAGTDAHVVRWRDLGAETDGHGVSRGRLEGAGVSLLRIELPSGTVAAEHSHAHEQFVQVMSGAGTLTTSAGTHDFAAGDLFRFPPGTRHSARFSADTDPLPPAGRMTSAAEWFIVSRGTERRGRHDG